jgi:copper chaperone CopZ
VSRAEVSLRAKQAVVVYDPGRVTVEAMIEAVNRLGFRASRKDSR